MTWGKLYAVGVGPGDPELLTLKARRILSEVQVVAMPQNRDGKSYAYSIASEWLDPRRQEILRLPFALSGSEENRRPYWETATKSLLDRLREGMDVAYITEGDPLLYSTFIPLLQMLQRQQPYLEIEIIPGISSVNSSAAKVAVPLARGTERVAILTAIEGREEIQRAVQNFDTVVLLKFHSHLAEVRGVLTELGLEDRVWVVERCGTPEERIFYGLKDLPAVGLSYFATMIIKKGS